MTDLTGRALFEVLSCEKSKVALRIPSLTRQLAELRSGSERAVCPLLRSRLTLAKPGISSIRAAALSERSPWEFERLYRNAYSTPDDADNAIVTACCTISHDVKRIKNGETDRHRFSRIGLITNQRVQHQSYVLYVLFIFLVVLYGDVCLPKPLRVMGNCLHIDSPSRTRDGITSHKRETDFLRRRQFLRTWSGCRPFGSWIRCTRAR